MARRGGVKRIQIDIYDTIRAVIMSRLRDVSLRAFGSLLQRVARP